MPISTRQLLFVVALCATQALLVCNYALAVTFLTIDMAKLGATPFVIATIFSSFELGKLVCSFFGTVLTAHFGRYAVLVTGVLLSASFSACFGIIPEITDNTGLMSVLLIVSRLLLGCGVALAQQSIYAILSDSFPESRGLVVGSANSMVAIGYMVGPAVGGALFTLGGFRLPFLVVGSLVGLCVAPIIALYPKRAGSEPTPDSTARPAEEVATKKAVTQGVLVAQPAEVWTLAVIQVFYMAKWAWWDVYITEWCLSEFDLSILQASLCITLLAGMFGVLTPLSGILGDWLGNNRILLVASGVTLLTALYVFVGPWQLAWSMSVRWPLFLLYLVLDGLFCVPVEPHILPTMLGLAEASAGARSEELTNLVVAVAKTAMNFGRVAGPFAAVPIIESFGMRGLYAVWAIPFGLLAAWTWL
jgi:MFS family permease